MDTLSLRRYTRPSSIVDKNFNSLNQFSKKHKSSKGNTTLTGNGLINSDKEFFEFFINNKPLSELLDAFYSSTGSILDNWIGVLGSSVNKKTEFIKLKQLLGKNITDEEIRQAFPASWSDSEFEWYLDKYREELSNPEIIIYCCPECGDYDCGGITVNMVKKENSLTWTFSNNSKNLTFEFDKYLYFELLNRYLDQLK